MRYDPAYSATAIAARVPLPHARLVLCDARDNLHNALSQQPRDRAWRAGPLDSPEVLAAHDGVEIWTAVVALHERRARGREVSS